MQNKRLLLFIVILFLILPGCWSRNEIEDLGIVAAIGIDKVRVDSEEKYKLSTLVLRPPQLGGGTSFPTGEKNPDWLLSEVGNSLYDAGRNLARRSPRIISLYHNSVIIIGEKVARDGITDTLDFLQRHKDVRLRNLVIISHQDAKSIMQTMPEVEQTLTMEMSELIVTTNPRVSESYPVDLNEFTQALVHPGQDAVAPVIQILEPSEVVGNQRGEKEPAQTVMLGGLGVFRKDKLVGFLSPEESKGFLYVIGQAKSGIIPVRLKEKGEVSFMMGGAKTRYRPTIRNGRMEMDLIVEAMGNVAEVGGQVPVGDPKELKELEKVFSASIKRLMTDTIKKAQKKFRADIFGFGKHIYIEYPQYWREIEKEWYDLYPELPVNITVDGKLKRTNNIADPFKIK